MGSIYVVPEQTAHQYSVCFQCSTTTSTSLDHYAERDRVSESQLLDSFNFRKQRFFVVVVVVAGFWCVLFLSVRIANGFVCTFHLCARNARRRSCPVFAFAFSPISPIVVVNISHAHYYSIHLYDDTHVTRLRNSLFDRFAQQLALVDAIFSIANAMQQKTATRNDHSISINSTPKSQKFS